MKKFKKGLISSAMALATFAAGGVGPVFAERKVTVLKSNSWQEDGKYMMHLDFSIDHMELKDTQTFQFVVNVNRDDYEIPHTWNCTASKEGSRLTITGPVWACYEARKKTEKGDTIPITGFGLHIQTKSELNLNTQIQDAAAVEIPK
jgi:hypothetical protein